MKFEKQESPQGFCIFCEDIRQEINGKQTFVGTIPGGELNVLGVLPTAIGKFCIHATYKQRLSDDMGPLVIEVHMPGDDEDKPTARAQTSLSELAEKLAQPESDDPFIGIAMGFEFNPLEIKKEGKILVSAIRAGKRYKLGALGVKSRPLEQKKEAAN
ncbi:hypothetical protein BH10PSE11_BH10PSE11_30940 [soil metagenome]